MRDVVMLLTIVAFFTLCLAYVRWCDHIIGPDDAELAAERDDQVADAARRNEVAA
ncbi:MAG: potassium transporter Trk [Ilumatobacteraceae bacterium]